MTLDDVKQRAEQGRRRLRALGITERNVEARLRWKESRGIDVTVERRMLKANERAAQADQATENGSRG